MNAMTRKARPAPTIARSTDATAEELLRDLVWSMEVPRTVKGRVPYDAARAFVGEPPAALRVRLYKLSSAKRGWALMLCFYGDWKSATWVDEALLSNVKFVISEPRRKNMLRTGRTAVHTWIEGDLVSWSGKIRGTIPLSLLEKKKILIPPTHGQEMSYDMNVGHWFRTSDRTQRAIEAAEAVYVSTDSGVWLTQSIA